jgi:sacsin
MALTPAPAPVQPPSAPTPGLAYCFLPLPVPTGLPVHCNGYFELSSNR